MRKICFVTATRAEYWLLKPLLNLVDSSEELDLQLIVTGAHLSPEFGLTFEQIEQDGYSIDEKIETLLSADTPSSIVKTMGLTMLGFSDTLKRLNPDLIVILGDRYEMLAIASAATIHTIPIAHIHGGEITEGAYDDAIRHAITKMSHLHFASTEQYRNRLIQMGEQPDTVYNVGAIGLDNVRNLKLWSKEELENDLGIKFKKFNYQVTFHPETLGELSSQQQFQNLLDVIEQQDDSFFIFTKCNADTDGRIINQMIDDFVSRYPQKSKAFTTLGSIRFLSLIYLCDAIIGNSSSGIIEAPSLKTITLNIGDRQKGRIQAESIINVGHTVEEIKKGFKKIIDSDFAQIVQSVTNPYDQGGASSEIFKRIVNSKKISTVKRFYNL